MPSKTLQQVLDEAEYQPDEPWQQRCRECGYYVIYQICKKCGTHFGGCPCGWLDADCECGECVGEEGAK